MWKMTTTSDNDMGLIMGLSSCYLRLHTFACRISAPYYAEVQFHELSSFKHIIIPLRLTLFLDN